MIVGIKTEAFKDWRWVEVNGRYHKAFYFDVTKYELHPTKGWRRIFHAKQPVDEKRWRRAPATERRWQSANQPSQRSVFAQGSRLQPTRDLVQVRDPQGSTRHLQRHGWYRRQLRKEAEARVKAKLEAAYA